jgi:hypothetical protein
MILLFFFKKFKFVLDVLDEDLVLLDDRILLDVLLAEVLQLLSVFFVVILYVTQHLNLCFQ